MGRGAVSIRLNADPIKPQRRVNGEIMTQFINICDFVSNHIRARDRTFLTILRGSVVRDLPVLTLFLHVTCKWYFEFGQSDSCASAVSVSRFPMMPPPKYSQLTKHWIGSYCKFHTMSAITSDPSRNIDWTSNLIVSDAIHDVVGVLSSIVLAVDAADDFGEQLFQHCTTFGGENDIDD